MLPIRSRMRERRDELITGTLTFGEVVAGPYRRGLSQLAEKTRGQLHSMVSEISHFTLETVEHYARIRGTFGIKPADAVHLACAVQARTDLFLTNDTGLLGKVIPESSSSPGSIPTFCDAGSGGRVHVPRPVPA